MPAGVVTINRFFQTSLLVALITFSGFNRPRLEAADGLREAVLFFENSVRPVLVKHRVKCHGAKKSESGLRLDDFTKLRAGGDSGPALIPGDPDQSLIIQAVRHDGGLAMPPQGKLEEREVAALVKLGQGGCGLARRNETGGRCS